MRARCGLLLICLGLAVPGVSEATSRAFVRTVLLEGLSSGVLPETEALRLEVELVLRGDVLGLPVPTRPPQRFPLWALGGRDGRWIDHRAIQRVLDRIADAYRARGLYGARVRVDAGVLHELASPAGRGVLAIRVEEPTLLGIELAPGGFDRLRVRVRELLFRGDLPDLLSDEELLSIDVALAWRGDGYAAAGPAQSVHEVELRALLSAEGPALYGSALQAIVRGIAAEYRDRGLRGARFEVSEQVLADLRAPSSPGRLVVDVRRW